jgi:hypothetical protein
VPVIARVLAACAISCASCTSIGPCDEAAAREIVYDEDGVPAYAGQALAMRSCGGGSTCHSEGAIERHGAPAGLDFDLPVSTNGEVDGGDLDRLDRHQRTIARNRALIWGTIDDGSMPPGEVGDCVRENGPLYSRRNPSGSYSPLPELTVPQGREIFRNWLACATPIIERTQPRVDGVATEVGWIEPEASPPRSCAAPTWPSIYASIIGPRCAIAGCHVEGDPSATPYLEADGMEEIYAVAERLIDRGDPETENCGSLGMSWVVPNDPDASLLYLKIGGGSGPPCGIRMPLAGSFLPQQRIDAIGRWIECGACTDPSCEAECESDDIVPEGCEIITSAEPRPAACEP